MIYLGMSPWEGMWRNRHQLMSRFARAMPVLYVEPWVRTRQIRTGSVGFRRLVGGLAAPSRRCTQSGVHVLTSPPHRPVAQSGRFHRASVRRWAGWVARHAAAVGIRRPVLWVSQPGMKSIVGKLDEVLSIYHIVDEYAGYTGHDESRRAALVAAEDQMLDAVDLSIVVSDALLEAKRGAGRQIFVVPNAVDYPAFAAASDRGEEPADLAAIPKPRVGYTGLVGVRLDLGLIGAMAAEQPDTQFVFVGDVDRRECEEALSLLEGRDNVHFLGRKPASAVPDYVAGLDVGLLPYRLNLETRHISPLKLYEYLAAGKPVVSTPIPAALPFSDTISIAEKPEEFSGAVIRAMASDSARLREERQQLARRNTWDDRVAAIGSIIHEALDAPAGLRSAAGEGLS
jgi:glycosyltransferase involved in cell wall biosynthesis